MSGQRQATTVERALTVLAILGRQSASFSTLVQTTGCPAPTLSRLLKGLVAADLVTGGNGLPYQSTSHARALGQAIAGEDDPIIAIRRELAALSDILGTGCAWFRIEATGVRCLVRHLIPEGVGILAEGALRSDLRGHGCAVSACALSTTVNAWHARTLRSELQLTATLWQKRIKSIREQGYDLSYAMEGVPGHGLRMVETLARLSVPNAVDNENVYVLGATGHGLSAKRVFPDSAIAAAKATTQKIAHIWQQMNH
jgi:DNA-binding IclR family transcriptional regulator